LTHCTTSRKVVGSNPDGIIGIFHLLSLPATLGLGVDPASTRNENQEYFLWGKGGRCVGVKNLPPKVWVGVEVQIYHFFYHGARWEWVFNAMLRKLYFRETNPVPILQEAVWASGKV